MGHAHPGRASGTAQTAGGTEAEKGGVRAASGAADFAQHIFGRMVFRCGWAAGGTGGKGGGRGTGHMDGLTFSARFPLPSVFLFLSFSLCLSLPPLSRPAMPCRSAPLTMTVQADGTVAEEDGNSQICVLCTAGGNLLCCDG